MIVHEFGDAPPKALADSLGRFEFQFSYPLGEHRSFRISHGADYPRFFRAMGDARCFAVEQDGHVVGVLGAVLRTLLLPDGRESKVAYFADLKVAQTNQRGRVLLRLFQAAQTWAQPRAAAAFGVVMQGTAATPERYTGRLGFPLFSEVGRLVVLRLNVPDEPVETNGVEQVDLLEMEETYRVLSRGRFASAGGVARERSETNPVAVAMQDGSACGLVEDTRRAKRLFDSEGAELQSAHVSSFAYREPESAARLLRACLEAAGKRGFPALFVCVAESDAPEVLRYIGAEKSPESTASGNVVTAPAVVFGAGLDPGFAWNINTAEI